MKLGRLVKLSLYESGSISHFGSKNPYGSERAALFPTTFWSFPGEFS